MLHILIPIGEDEDETSLKVIRMACYRSKVVTFIFSSVTEQWCTAASSSSSWTSLGIVVEPDRKSFYSFNYLRGCFYWSLPSEYKLLVLDLQRVEFSTLSIHPGYYMQFRGQSHNIIWTPTVVEGMKGTLEVFNLVGDLVALPHFTIFGARNDLTPFYIYHTFQQKGEEGKPSSEWQLLNVIELPRRYQYYTVGAAEGFLFLGVIRRNVLEGLPDDWGADVFSLEVKTSELKKVCRATRIAACCFRSYFGYPPSLSTPSL